MAIRIWREGTLYRVAVTPPHGGGRYWSFSEPLPADEVVRRLQEMGCHQTDIGDAIREADPFWLNRMSKETFGEGL
jgi:hypothetical protein